MTIKLQFNLAEGKAFICSEKEKETALEEEKTEIVNRRVRDGRWTAEEHKKFLVCLRQYGRCWKKIQTIIGTRTATQVRSHAQKYFAKLAALGLSADSIVEDSVSEPSQQCSHEINDSETFSQTPCVSPLIKQQCSYQGPVEELPALDEQESACRELHFEEPKAQQASRKRKAPLRRPRVSLAAKYRDRPRIRRRKVVPERQAFYTELSCDSSYCHCLEPELDSEFEDFELDSPIQETIPIIQLENSIFWNEFESDLPAFLTYP
eukprot:TRINITY_DN11122_c0_g2_i6.p1 TRINITY_DN11122_c0_g2~~TRINITY_DN11122_c0_g2_i6.p1  ORF type:complete len:264 (+),score=29.34 TRINITY_DN11122_c0_g2_i6:168-959(+)